MTRAAMPDRHQDSARPGRGDPGGGTVRVLAIPAYRNREGNPYNALLSEAIERAGGRVAEFSTRALLSGRADVWHLHWPDHALHRPGAGAAALGLARFAAKVAIAKATATRIVWTVHNARPHEVRFPALTRALRALLLRSIDAWIALSAEARDEALAAMPRLARTRCAVIPHGHYRPCYPDPPDAPAARRLLDLPPDGRVVLFFGEIRPYKNVAHLLRTFRSCPDPDLRLVVAGRAAPGLAAELRALASPDPRVRLDVEFIPEDRVPAYFAAADLVALPFSRTLNSGSAILALSMDTPVLVPAVGSMPALRREVGPDWVHLFEGTLSPPVLATALAAAGSVRGRAPIEHLNWDGIGRDTLDLYRAVVRAREGHRGTAPFRARR